MSQPTLSYPAVLARDHDNGCHPPETMHPACPVCIKLARLYALRRLSDDYRDIASEGARYVGECDSCHCEGALLEDDINPGGFCYCLACFARVRANVARKIQLQRREALAAGATRADVGTGAA